MAQNFGYNEAFAIPEYNQALVNWLYIACALFAMLTFVCITLSMFSVDSKNLKMKWWTRVSSVVTSLVVVFCINAIPAQEDNNEQAKFSAIEEHTGLVSIMWHEQEGYFTAVDEGGDYIVAELVEPESGTFVIVPVQP